MKAKANLPVVEYRARPLRLAERAAWWGVFALPATGVLFYSFERAYFFYSHYGPVAAYWRPRPLWMLAAAWALLGLLLFLRRLRRSRAVLRIERTGVVFAPKPSKAISITWQELLGIRFRPAWANLLAPSAKMWLRTRRDEVKIDSRFPDLPEIAHELQARLLPHLLPALRKRRARGKAVQFGDVAVSPEGIFYRRLYAWRSIKRIALESGFLMLELDTSKVVKIPVQRVENPEILVIWLRNEWLAR